MGQGSARVAAAYGRGAIVPIRARESFGASSNGRLGDVINKALKAVRIIEIAIETIGVGCASSGAA